MHILRGDIPYWEHPSLQFTFEGIECVFVLVIKYSILLCAFFILLRSISLCFLRLHARVSHLRSAKRVCILQRLVATDTIRAASFWTDSMSFFSSAVQLSHTTSPYSKRDLMKLRYIFSRLERESMNFKRGRSIPNLCHVFWVWKKYCIST